MDDYDLAIIGGGPIGSTLALEVAQRGKRVAVIDRKKTIGYPSHCSGMVSVEFAHKFKLPEHLVLNRIKGARVFSKDNSSIEFKRDFEFALVIDRILFDKELFLQAKTSGAQYLLGYSLVGYERSRNGIILYLEGEDKIKISAKIIAIATGAASSVKRMFGFTEEGIRINTIQTEEIFPVEDNSIVYIYMNNEIAKNWFAWLIPTRDGKARIGFGTEEKVISREKLVLLKDSWSLLNGANISFSNPVFWSIPIGLARRTATDNCIIVGDAALQTKPFSGGGLFTGMSAAKIASSVISDCIERGDFSKEALAEYEKKWRSEIGREIRIEKVMREIYVNLADKDKDDIIRNFDVQTLNRIVEKHGFIDAPWKAGFRIVLKGWGVLLKYLRRKVGNLFTSQ